MLNFVTVTGTFHGADGSPLTGQVVFTPSQSIYAGGVQVAAVDTPITAQIVGGQLQALDGDPVTLLATDNAGLTYLSLTGWFAWDVQVTAGGIVQVPWSFFLPSSPGTVDLFELANTGAGGGGGGSGTVTSMSVASANGFSGTVANPTTTPAVTVSTSVSGLLKGNGTGVTAAASGTDYAPATSGAAILKGNGSGGFSAATAGTDYAPATSGSAILKGSGSGGFTNAAAGTDYVSPTGSGAALTGLTVGQVSGAAPAANPTFTGTVTVPTTVNATDAAQKAYVDSVASGLDAKPSVTALATANITLSGTQTIDGVAVTAGNRVLCTGQSTSSQNGLWTVASGSWSRPTDFATGSTQLGAYAYTEAGTANASSGWVLTGASPVTVDTSAQTWTQFSGAGEVVAGTGLSKSGNTLSVATDSTTGDIQPSPGTAAAGGNGKPADAAHVHPQPPFLAPTASTGATAAVRYLAGTVSGPPQSGTWAVGDVVPDQAGAVWECVSAGTAPLNGQFRRLGDHAWQFRVECYGAKGDGKVVTDAVMSSTSPNLACATSTPFTSTGVDGGKHILVSTATGAYAHLATTISTVTDSGHAVLSGNATANTGGTPGAIAYFGTDDTAAIQAAINAATSYAQAHGGYAEVVFGSKIYIIAGAFTAQALGNAQIALPVISPTATTGQVVLSLRGAQDTTPLMHWLQVAPQSSGTILACASTSGTADAGSGPSVVIGSPVSGYGGEPGLYSNVLVQVRGIGMLLPYNATMGGLDLFGMLEADVESFSCMAAAVVPASSAPAPSLGTQSNITHQWTFGVRMPTTGNQTVCRLVRYSSEGMTYGFCPSEWTYAADIHVMYAIVAIGAWAGGVTMVHAAMIVDAQVENCTNALAMASTNAAGNNGTGIMRLDILSLQTESTGAIIFDTGNQIQGTIHLRGQGSSGAYSTSGYLSGGSGGQQLRIINEMTAPGPITTPHAVVASGSPWFNGYTRDAWITLAATTITALSITGQNGVTVAQAVPASATTYAFFLPTGASYTWTGTGSLVATVTLF